MSQSAAPDAPLGPRARLFEPGERLGWIYRDPNQFRRPFLEPAPAEPPPPPAPSSATPLIWIPIVIGLVLACCGGSFASVGGSSTSDGDAALLSGIGIVGLLAGLALAVGGPVLMVTSRNSRIRTYRDRLAALQATQQNAVRAWQQRGAQYNYRENVRIAGLAEWGAATAGAAAKRIDLYGGHLWSWEAFLTVFGSSMLGSRREVTVLDLSNEAVSTELLTLAAAAAYRVDAHILPEQLPECDLLSGLDPKQLVDVLIESIHGDEASGNLSNRAKDSRILVKICDALGADLTLPRLGEAVRALMGEPIRGEELARDERDRIVGELFSAEYIQASYDSLTRIEAHIHPLERLGSRPRMVPNASLRAIVLRGDGPSARNDLLADLLVQWMMRSLAKDESGAPDGVLIVVGADSLQRRHLERLSDISSRRSLRLVYLFRHLRESSLHLLGSGVVGFMKLGNHEEAERAATFIGRGHSFMLSQLTKTTGGSETHTDSTTEGYSEALTPFGTTQMIPTRSRNWGLSSSVASGSSWSNSTTTQRVYEYRVEPTVIQNMPDYAMLLTRSEPAGAITLPVDCNPDIVFLPKVLYTPLPSPREVQESADARAVIDVLPGQVTQGARPAISGPPERS